VLSKTGFFPQRCDAGSSRSREEKVSVDRDPTQSPTVCLIPIDFQWDDPFLLDEQLTEDERMIRDTARTCAQDKLLPRVKA
jgi:hypothetical protein